MMRQNLLALMLLGFVQIWLAGCSTPAHVGEYPNQQRMVGKSKSSILACAGTPHKETSDGERTFLRYYREAPILEESRPVGKGSFATIRHGCWATVILIDDRVVDVHYRFVPPTFDASNDCEDIFDSCQ
ncbi:MAG: hypothetical protein KF751_16950 [Nitrospira sp.]|uniref:hypothetical protein n=1 Tax=Nitrospira sp. BLG_1 TaxID=3395883 RepID=UPI001E0F3CB4|nr:hypothetical protein [Nitrospira sp.]